MLVYDANAPCDKQDSPTSDGLCHKLHGGLSQQSLFAVHQSRIRIAIFSSSIAITAYPTCMHLTPPLEAPRRNIAMTFGTEKTRMVCLPDGEKISKVCLFVSTESTNVADRQTDAYGRTDTACVTA